MIFNIENSINQQIYVPESYGVQLELKREDAIHEFVSGNKYRKLKYNLQEAKKQGSKTLLTFGGAFSNHIAAVAAAGALLDFKTIGVIRGEELQPHSNATLQFASQHGMKFMFVSREMYREKVEKHVIDQLKKEFGDFYLVPEGGTNGLAVKGCEEIITETDRDFHYLCCAVGTGGTISGIINSSGPNQKVIGFPALKGNFLQKDINNFVSKTNWELNTDYHFGGYAKINAELVTFINEFKKVNHIPLDPVYTGKMLYGIFDLINKGYFEKGSKILAIHTGGLQGVEGMNAKLKIKNLPIIE
ncbi:1-aminocyclopropane-1-carboxylate deaminase/D-cysteine desulfhydrase [Gaetbulibacter saemankumensis]|uniref:1-aminocyclopropane-1-carboxylate deaminase/D-cysteine desulfhydrase n=1 Tax=Gaetbulibacter saemankumensis TaxID=311208 RepID=UPI000429282A|nr:pyridoxal-phosphate dependent enzyme [Gaetbulibacter saemankumensis]